MRRVPTAPADVIANPVLGNAAQGIVRQVDAAFRVFVRVAVARQAAQPIVFVRQERVIELKNETGIDDRFVFLL